MRYELNADINLSMCASTRLQVSVNMHSLFENGVISSIMCGDDGLTVLDTVYSHCNCKQLPLLV